LRRSQTRPFAIPVVPTEYTNWRDEQRAWRETCGFWEMSHHMTDLYIEGPDALNLLADLGINKFKGFEVNRAKQFVACNPDGYMIGDAVLSYLHEQRFNLVGIPTVPNWVQFNAEVGGYDVSLERDENSAVREGPPKIFRFQIQGPNARGVMEKASEGSLPEIPFFNIGEFTVSGRNVRALGHGMARQPGYELFGPWEHADEVADTIVEAGQEFGLRKVGSIAFPTSALESGWLAFPLPAIYAGEQMKGYREWLGARNLEVIGSLGGSFDSEDITDYYLDPVEAGYGRLIDFDHDFVGRDALRATVENPRRTKVTLVWNAEDITDALGSFFRQGDTAKYINLPSSRYSVFQYDKVLKDGETVGVSTNGAYTYNERAMLSLAVVNVEHSEPGTEVTLLWGEPGSTKPHVERHVQVEIRATVAPAPLHAGRSGDVGVHRSSSIS